MSYHPGHQDYAASRSAPTTTELIESVNLCDEHAVASILSRASIFAITQTSFQQRPLHLAAKLGHANILTRLLAAGADPSATDSFGNFPLHYACAFAQVEAATVLLASDPLLFDRPAVSNGMTPLHYAILATKPGNSQPDQSDRGLSIIRLLLDAAQNVESPLLDFPSTLTGWTPLHCAAARLQPSVSRLLLTSGSLVDTKDFAGNTPLHLAFRSM